VKISNETRVGILATFAITIIIVGVNFLRGNNVFSRDVRYYAKFTDVGGLASSNAVMLYGVKIGQVDALSFITLRPEDSVVRNSLEAQAMELTRRLGNRHLTLRADSIARDSMGRALRVIKEKIDKYEQRVEVKFHVYGNVEFPSNSVAKIKSDLLGAKTLEIVPGNAKTFAHKNDTLIGAVELTLTEELSKTVSPIKDRVSALVGSIDTVVTSLNEIFNDKTIRDLKSAVSSIPPTIKNIENTTAGLNTLVGTESARIHSILINIDKISQNVTSYSTSINKVLDNMGSVTDSLRAINFKKTITEATTTINTINEILLKVKSGQGTLGKLVNDDKLYQDLVSATRNVDKLVYDLKMNPNKYFAPLGRRERKPLPYKPDTAK
jgi:phospholipid/cholesterol/gamma-HCH transport system substrate-binding protein